MDPETPWSASTAVGEAPYYSVPYSALPPQIKARRQTEGAPGDGLEFKSLAHKAEIKVDKDSRQARLWIARMGTDYVDDGGDMIPKGAADRTIEQDGPGGQELIKFFFDHSTLMGPALEVEAKKDGIIMLGQFDDDPAIGKFYAHAQSGAAKHGSIGYHIENAHRDTLKGKPIRVLDEIKLYEGSLVVWPMNRAATLIEAKAARIAPVQALLPKGITFSEETKNLYGAACLVRALAEIDGCYQEIARILADDEYWGNLSPEDRATIDKYLDMMVANGEDAGAKRSAGRTETESNSSIITLARVKAADKLLTALRETSSLFTKGNANG